MIVAFTENGIISGEQKNKSCIFRGIPYARAPVGSLRFAPPANVQNWEGIRKCSDFAPAPVQYFEPKDPLPAPRLLENCSEDCLYLNIVTPATVREIDEHERQMLPEHKDTGSFQTFCMGEKLPVYVFLYGGGFQTGGSQLPLYQGENLARKGIIYVNLNYRLNVFGFLAMNTLYEEAGTTGNYGLLDIVCALRWVRRNIASFGGDPENITLGGQSAGAMAVSLLLHSSLTEGIFQRCILESGAVQGYPMQHASLAKAVSSCNHVFSSYGIADDRAGIKKLREWPAELLLERWIFEKRWKRRNLIPIPVLDGVILHDKKIPNPRKDKVHSVDLLFGWNENEGSIFVPKYFGRQECLSLIRNLAGYSEKSLQKRFENLPDDMLREQTSGIAGDFMFRCAMVPYGDILSRVKNVYSYHFNFMTEKMRKEGLGCRHMTELYYVFGNQLQFVGGDNEEGKKMSEFVQTAWTNFIKTGNPNEGNLLPGGIRWEPYKEEERKQLYIGDQIFSRKIPDSGRLRLYENIVMNRKILKS